MHSFLRILFVSHGAADETEGLKQAMSLVRNNGAELEILVVCPEFPKNLPDYRKKYEDLLVKQAEASVGATRTALKIAEAALPVVIRVESGDLPGTRIIRHVLRHDFDLVVKEAESKEGGVGFKAMDMELLRKCPCTLWLCRPIRQRHDDIHVAVAVDPESEEKAARDLSLRLLQLAYSLSETCSKDLSIISCWDYEYENDLRSNVWIKISEEELLKTVTEARSTSGAKLKKLIGESGIGNAHHVHHVRGRPDQIIPSLVEDKKVDILVMGTVARTGIPGFIIGNTAENIVQKLSCSLLALKPGGFISPVKAYE